MRDYDGLGRLVPCDSVTECDDGDPCTTDVCDQTLHLCRNDNSTCSTTTTTLPCTTARCTLDASLESPMCADHTVVPASVTRRFDRAGEPDRSGRGELAEARAEAAQAREEGPQESGDQSDAGSEGQEAEDIP